MKRTLVGGVGYHNLRDLSLGPVLTERLAGMSLPAHVTVDADMSFGPVAIVQRFQAEPVPYERIVLFSAVDRGLKPGTITTYRWDRKLPPVDEVQARVGEAVTGVVSLDNLLVVGEQFGIWPPDTLIVEIQPEEGNWGEGFSPTIEARIETILDVIYQVASTGEMVEGVHD